MGERGTGGRLRMADLEAHDWLACLGTATQRGDERVGSIDVSKQADRLRFVVFREECDEVGSIRHGFSAGRDDTAQPDTPAEGEKCVGDRS